MPQETTIEHRGQHHADDGGDAAAARPAESADDLQPPDGQVAQRRDEPLQHGLAPATRRHLTAHRRGGRDAACPARGEPSREEPREHTGQEPDAHGLESDVYDRRRDAQGAGVEPRDGLGHEASDDDADDRGHDAYHHADSRVVPGDGAPGEAKRAHRADVGHLPGDHAPEHHVGRKGSGDEEEGREHHRHLGEAGDVLLQGRVRGLLVEREGVERASAQDRFTRGFDGRSRSVVG